MKKLLWKSATRLNEFSDRDACRYTLGKKLQQQITLCVLETFWENLSVQQNFVAATSHTNSV